MPKPDLEDHEYELWGQNMRDDFVTVEKMYAYAAQVEAATIERCAKVCDKEAERRANREAKPEHWDDPRIQGHKAITARTIAAAIRALGQTREQG